MQLGLLALLDGEVHQEGPGMPAVLRYARVVLRKLCKITFKLRDEVAVGPRQFVGKRLRHLWLQFRIRVLGEFAATGQRHDGAGSPARRALL